MILWPTNPQLGHPKESHPLSRGTFFPVLSEEWDINITVMMMMMDLSSLGFCISKGFLKGSLASLRGSSCLAARCSSHPHSNKHTGICQSPGWRWDAAHCQRAVSFSRDSWSVNHVFFFLASESSKKKCINYICPNKKPTTIYHCG